MNAHASQDQVRESQSQSPVMGQSMGGGAAFQLQSRPEALQMQRVQQAANNSPQVQQLKAYQAGANSYAQGQGIVQCMFSVGAQKFDKPKGHEFTLSSALNATQPIPRGSAQTDTGRGANSGVEVGQVGSYGYVQYLEQTGDGLTGDHQPSGAAVKEAIREMLHTALNKPLTRSMARNAYKKAITIVMTDVWHKLYSRTYGGRNTKAQIIADSQDLMSAAMEDWKTTVPGLKKEGFSDLEIESVWKDLCAAREDFFKTGDAQAGSL